MDWEKVTREIKARILAGKISADDVELALDIQENAPEIWSKTVWLRELGSWVAEVDRNTVDYLRSQIEVEDSNDADHFQKTAKWVD